MASTEARIRELVAENLEVDGKPLSASLDLTASLADAGVSSMDVLSFGKVVAQEFNVSLTPEDCSNIENLQALINFIDSRAS